MDEHDYDEKLHIKTAGTLEVLNQSVHYNRYEATPYTALEELFDSYELSEKDGIVDFGCGKGRVTFYMHNRTKADCIGIEMNGRLYQDAQENLSGYLASKKKWMKGSISFERCYAEEYEIQPYQNKFYFFNPFSIQLFMKVVDHILKSIEDEKRQVDLILYYPTADYIHYLEASTTFTYHKEVKVTGLYEQNENERFIIFRYECPVIK